MLDSSWNFVYFFVGVVRCEVPRHFAQTFVKIRVKNREPVPVYAMEMDPHERDSDMGDDSPMVSPNFK